MNSVYYMVVSTQARYNTQMFLGSKKKKKLKK